MHSRPFLLLAAAIASAPGAEVTIHDGGKLIVKSQLTAAGDGVLVESGGQLQLDGTTDATVAVATGGLLTVGGDSVASVQINGALSLDGTLQMQIGSVAGAPVQDHISGLTSLTLGGTLDLQHLAGDPLTASQSFDLWDAAATTGSVPQLAGSSLPAGLFYHTWDLPSQGTLHVSCAAETYQQWAAAYGAGDSGTDLNHDGTVNLIEFALALPTDGGGNTLSDYEVVQDASGTSLALLVHLPVPAPPSAAYFVEASDSLEAAAWQVVAQRTGNGEWSGTATVTPTSSSNGIQTYRIADPAPAGSSKRFMRLRVE
jgi:hypothetical protein